MTRSDKCVGWLLAVVVVVMIAVHIFRSIGESAKRTFENTATQMSTQQK
jgi:Flp pilus assembly pilin Flp